MLPHVHCKAQWILMVAWSLIAFIFIYLAKLPDKTINLWISGTLPSSGCQLLFHICRHSEWSQCRMVVGRLWWWGENSVFGLYIWTWIFTRTSGQAGVPFLAFTSCTNGLCCECVLHLPFFFTILWIPHNNATALWPVKKTAKLFCCVLTE